MCGSQLLAALIAAALPALASAAPVSAPPYSDAGQQNPVDYTFTATATGAVDAYFAAASKAAYAEAVELVDNGVATDDFVLVNHSSSAGQEVLLGNVQQGDTLSFNLVVYTRGTYGAGRSYMLSSVAADNLAANGGMDTAGNGEHVYATSYTQGEGLASGIPNGTYVGFEDGRVPGADLNYVDETAVFTDVGVTVREPASVALLAVGLAASVFAVRRRRD